MMTENAEQFHGPTVGTGLLVLGMHRSGTSALTGMLHLLGANLGKQLVQSEPDINLKGYWENKEANQFDDRLLKFLGTDWYDVLDLPEDWCLKSKTAGFTEELGKLITYNFEGKYLWAVKDPRLCRLLPLWLDVGKQLNIELKCLIVLRHPLEVAQSLKKRNGFELPHAVLLWLRYVLDSELNSRHVPREIITYENLLTGWTEVFKLVELNLKLGLSLKNKNNNSHVDKFLDSSLRHHVNSENVADGHLLKLAVSAYETLQSQDIASLDQIRDHFNSALQEFEPWLSQLNHIHQSLNECQLQNGELRAQNEIMKNSRSWRWTAPARLLAHKKKPTSQR